MNRWVVFDLGGVLVRITLKVAVCAGRIGLELPSDWAYQDFQEVPEFLPYQAGQISDDAYLEALACRLQTTPERALELHDAILIEPYPGSEALVAEVKAQGYQTGVLSNTNQPHWHEIMTRPRWEFVAHVDHAMGSHEVRLEKPDLAIYRAFEARSGARPESILYFDDTMPNVDGARAAGWTAHWIDRDQDPAGQMRRYLGLSER